MTEAAIATLDGRLTALEKTVPEGLRRIEDLIRGEIHDLKAEQLTEIRKSIDRIETNTKSSLDRVEADTKTAIGRISDDQRRLWEHVGRLELRDGQRTGADRTRGSIWYFFCAAIGSIVTAIITWLSKGGAPPHP